MALLRVDGLDFSECTRREFETAAREAHELLAAVR
jgi:hypothetical protein